MSEDVVLAVQKYRVALAAAKERAKAVYEAAVEEYVADERVELSRVLHEAHAAGTPIATLKSLTKAHNNAAYWYPMWNAYQPDQVTDLRRKNPALESRVNKVLRQDSETPSTWWFTWQGTEYEFSNVGLGEDGVSIHYFDADKTNPDMYRAGWSALRDHFQSAEATHD